MCYRKSYLLIPFVLFLLICNCSKNSSLTEIRIGWQTTWATEGQITQVLNHTNILALNGLNGIFKGVTYGAPLNEAALAGEVDVIFTADQPAAALIARGADWEIIGRLMFNRVAIYVPPESPIKTLEDLKNKTLAMPFGAAAQRVALKAIANAGLDPQKDVLSINLDITEQAGIVSRGSSSSWGDVDAMAGFDPTVAIFETDSLARMLHIGKVTSVIVMSKKYISANPEAPVKFLTAFKEAVFYYAEHEELANDWFRDASQLTFSNKVLALAASVEPNLKSESINDINLYLSPQLIQGIQDAANFIYEQNLVKQKIEVKGHINQEYLKMVESYFSTHEYNKDKVFILE